jgi:hypothetical protein
MTEPICTHKETNLPQELLLSLRKEKNDFFEFTNQDPQGPGLHKRNIKLIMFRGFKLMIKELILPSSANLFIFIMGKKKNLDL